MSKYNKKYIQKIIDYYFEKRLKKGQDKSTCNIKIIMKNRLKKSSIMSNIHGIFIE